MKLISFIILLVFISSCQQQKVKPSVDPSLSVEELPAQESWNATIFFSDSGRTTAILEAGHLQVFHDRQETFLNEGIEVDFYDTDEIKTTTLTAERGRVDDATRDLYAIDSVVVVSDSATIQTDELKWRNSDKKIVSDKFVTIITPKEKIQGYGFESDQNLQNYVIYNITYVTRRDSL